MLASLRGWDVIEPTQQLLIHALAPGVESILYRFTKQQIHFTQQTFAELQNKRRDPLVLQWRLLAQWKCRLEGSHQPSEF